MAPAVLLLKAIVVIVAPDKIVCVRGVADTAGTAFTSTVAVIGAPTHPLAVGVMVNVTVIGALVVFTNVPLIFPDPLAAIPVTLALLSLVQLYVVVATLPVKAIVVMAIPEHFDCEAGVATALGVGFTVIACMAFSEYPVLTKFVDQIKNMELSDIIRFGR